MAKKKRSIRLHSFLALLGILMIGTGSWALYSLINQGAGDLLLVFGIENVYAQLLIVIAVVLVGLMLSGVSLFKAIKTLVKG